ncbi:uncharacterized protein LOC115023426 [Cottoperca gobio]|uniref:Uncharacterized protein LOC115023426 n=1 Tax=Cottoperca gobio TaxID=56716 RepID=A0A6J2RH74_COTGO|nr:uncharacterized protein LOC115023426 [Cottoperca gobio]XP_029310243.1 uncharacterized protein LOC115023426 [Cottoperca gobio]
MVHGDYSTGGKSKDHQMLPSKHLKTVGQMPFERYVTTYSRDYKAFSQRHTQLDQLKLRTEAQAAPVFISPPQTLHETWYILHQYFYKTTNSIYGSSLQPNSSLFPASSGPCGVPAASMSEASGGVARETGPFPGEERGQLHNAFSGKANVLGQQEVEEEPQQKIDVVYEENVENWDNIVGGLGPATGLRSSTFLQFTSMQCSCCAWETDSANHFCLMMKTCIPRSSTLPPAHVQPTVCCTEPSREVPLTEYQARYTAEWAQPKMQQRDIHHRD